MATVALHQVGGNRLESTETALTVTGRPWQAGLRRRRLESIWVILSRLISDRIRPDQVKSSRNLSKSSRLTVTLYLTTVIIRR